METSILTTSQAAKMSGVCPRTVVKWIDDGLLKGWSLPNSNHRRIKKEDFLEFLKKHGIPIMGKDSEVE